MARPKLPVTAKQIVVATVDPKTLGFDVPQQAPILVEESFNAIGDDTTPISDWPTQKFADWVLEEYLAAANARGYRYADVALYAVMARQAYGASALTAALITALLPTVQYQRFAGVGPSSVGWDEYLLGDMRVIAIPGTEDINELLTYAGTSMQTMTGQPGSFLFYSGAKAILSAYETAIGDHYAAQLAVNNSSIILTGHSMGGAIANWLAYRFNSLVPLNSAKSYPIRAVYSFGAPAVWVDSTGVVNFLARHRHFRTVAPGDPVPGLVQEIIKKSSFFTSNSALKYRIPQHYATYATVVGQKPKDLDLQYQFSFVFYLAFILATKEAIDQGKAQHATKNYTGSLLGACRALGDTPIPMFGRLDAWETAMGKSLFGGA